ncbi:hypothetical protein CPB84DRAFT_1649348, partial [Gymnopilus junonius]
LYCAIEGRSRLVYAPSQCGGMRNFPCMDTILGGWEVQRHIHGAEVSLIDRNGQTHGFFVFFKNHCRLPMNNTVARLCNGRRWRGDLAVFRIAVSGTRLVNLRNHDSTLTNFVLKK